MMFRPYSSESGPTNIGPMPSPRTYKLMLRMVTSCEVCKSRASPVSVKEACVAVSTTVSRAAREDAMGKGTHH